MKGSAHTVPRMPGIVCLAALTAIGGCGDSAPGDEVVARAAGYELSVDQTADLLARQTQLPDQADVVEAIAGLWIDYTLFAVAVLEDSTFQHIDLLPLVRQEIEQELVARLRERVIQVDTAFTEEQLRQIYEEQSAGAEVRARHILLSLDPGADAPTADSVMEFAGGLRERILAGEDFAALAGEFSQDPGTATQGGDLGSFRRGQMVPAFDSAAFSLEPGELSGPVRTGFGVHILRVDERTQLPFEEARSQFEPQLKLGLVSQAEEAYLARVMSRAEMEPVDGGAEIARQLAARPSQRLSNRAAARELFRFEGGAYTAADFHRFLSEQGPPFRAQVRTATDDQLTGLLGNLAQSKVLVSEAELAGISLSDAEQDSLLVVARTRFTRAGPRSGADQRDAGGGGIDAGRRRGHRARRNAAHHRRRREHSGPRTPLVRAAGGVPFRRVREQLQRRDAAHQRVQGDPGPLPADPAPGLPDRGSQRAAARQLKAMPAQVARRPRDPAAARSGTRRQHGVYTGSKHGCAFRPPLDPPIAAGPNRMAKPLLPTPGRPCPAASPHPRAALLPRPGAGTGAGTPPGSRRRRRGDRRRFGDPAIRGAGTPAPDARQRGAHAGRSGGHHEPAG